MTNYPITSIFTKFLLPESTMATWQPSNLATQQRSNLATWQCGLIFLLFFTCIQANAQGLLIDEDSDSRYETLPQQSDFNDGGKSEAKALAGITAWSLKSYCPTPKHQGQVGSCVGWSTGYAALTIQHAIANEWKGQTDLITTNAFSPMFIYNQIKLTDCRNGSFIDSAMALLQTKGDILSSDFDKSIADCSVMPSEKQITSASTNKIVDFMTLFPHKAAKQTKINKVKLSLIQNRPAIVGMSLLKNFGQIRKGAKYWNPRVGDKGRYGGHAMVVIGFDDSRGAFELMNSWGEDWGNNGFIWVKYEDFGKYCKYAFQMSLEDKIQREKQYTGKFSLRRFEALLANGQPIFSDEKVYLSKGIYTLAKSTINTGTIFQFLVSQVTANTYMYAIGIEADGTTKTYWPEANESPLITVPEVELYLPGADAGLQFKLEGTEFVIILCSTQPIPNITDYLSQLAVAKGTVQEKLVAVFKNDLLPESYINYDKREMKFINEMPEGHIIPMVLKVEVTSK